MAHGLAAKKIPVKAGDFILAECWARINDSGETYFRIQLLKGENVSAEFYGGIVNGIYTWRPNSISGTKGWTKLRARVPVWPGIDSFRMVLCKDGEKRRGLV